MALHVDDVSESLRQALREAAAEIYPGSKTYAATAPASVPEAGIKESDPSAGSGQALVVYVQGDSPVSTGKQEVAAIRDDERAGLKFEYAAADSDAVRGIVFASIQEKGAEA